MNNMNTKLYVDRLQKKNTIPCVNNHYGFERKQIKFTVPKIDGTPRPRDGRGVPQIENYFFIFFIFLFTFLFNIVFSFFFFGILSF